MKNVDGILKVFGKTIDQLDVAAKQQLTRAEKLELIIAEADIDKGLAIEEANRASVVAGKLRDIIAV